MNNRELEIIFVRHAQSKQNTGEPYPDFHPDDAPLTETGLIQARALALRFSPGDLAAIYAGTLIRTCQTVQPTAEKLSIPVNVLPELMEVDTAVCGTQLSHVEKLAPAALESARRVLKERSGYTLAGETQEHCEARARELLGGLRRRYQNGETVLIATHGAFFGYLIRESLGLTLPEPFAWEVRNCAVTDIVFRKNDTPLLVCSNDQSHLYMV